MSYFHLQFNIQSRKWFSRSTQAATYFEAEKFSSRGEICRCSASSSCSDKRRAAVHASSASSLSARERMPGNWPSSLPSTASPVFTHTTTKHKDLVQENLLLISISTKYVLHAGIVTTYVFHSRQVEYTSVSPEVCLRFEPITTLLDLKSLSMADLLQSRLLTEIKYLLSYASTGL